MKRRKFIESSLLSGTGIAIGASTIGCVQDKPTKAKDTSITPIVIATWNVPNATAAAFAVIEKGGNSLDAIEQGCRIEEADEGNQSVGKGGRPDRDGKVTLDACIMNHKGDYGAVVCMQNITHAISVARKVMEETPHVLLAGKGAEQYALKSGFPLENLLTQKSKKEWQEWSKTSNYQPLINIENHDTIGMLAIDTNGDISGGCTTSGLAYKMAGRVGDSPIIGSGLFIDNNVGGATATGMGEEVLKTVGSFLIVELMRQGYSPQEACEEGIKRIVDKGNYDNFQVAYVALNKAGETGYYSIHSGFSATIAKESENMNRISGSFV